MPDAIPFSNLPVLNGAHGVSDSGRKPIVSAEGRDLLCALAYVSLGIGEVDQAVTLLDLVARDLPDDAGMLKLLAYAHVAAGRGAQALAALDKLPPTQTDEEEAAVLLLRSQALRLSGNLPEGQACFRRFVQVRRQAESAA